jgi:acetylornithine deacetylase/succinyl-diaminopimelate desuccinylase-like protein
MLVEGEEEAGGATIAELIQEQPERFAADICLVSDTGFIAQGIPAIEYGLRGIAYMQVSVRLADADLHSGLFGGGVMNPALALAHILASLKDPLTGKILIPGIYDNVPFLSDEEKQDLSRAAQSDETFLRSAANARAVHGEEGYTTIERTTARPSLDVNGIWAGFTGEGAKTIIPASAHAKVSIRIVGNEDPIRIMELFEQHIETVAPDAVYVSVQRIHHGDGVLLPIDSPCMNLAVEALEEAFGARPVFTRSGGSIPVVAIIKKSLGIDPIMIGYGLPDDGLHSPNEKFSLEQFEKGILCNMLLYKKIANNGQ